MRKVYLIAVLLALLIPSVPAYADPTPTPGHGFEIPTIPNPVDHFDIPPPLPYDHPNQVNFWWDPLNWFKFMYAAAASAWFAANRTYGMWYAIVTMGLVLVGFRFFFKARSEGGAAFKGLEATGEPDVAEVSERRWKTEESFADSKSRLGM